MTGLDRGTARRLSRELLDAALTGDDDEASVDLLLAQFEPNARHLADVIVALTHHGAFLARMIADAQGSTYASIIDALADFDQWRADQAQ